MPTRSLIAASSRPQRRPRTSTSPAVGGRSPSRTSIVVVLPAPLGPSRPKHSPARCNDWFGAVRDAVMLPAYGVTSACRGTLKNNRCVSTPTVRLGGGHQTRHERPSQPPAGNLVHADFGKLGLVWPGAPHVGDQQPTARTQHPNRL